MSQVFSTVAGRRMPMTRISVNIASFVTLGLGAAVTLAAFVHAAGWPMLFDRLALLPFCPYALLCVACLLARSRGRAIANFIVAALAALFALYWYINLIFLHPASMNGLVFFLVPMFQLPAAIILLLVLLFTRHRNRRPGT